MIGVEMGHDDLMVTDELFQDDEYDDHTYHNEYGPGGWNSIMMADDDNKHNWKAIHIVQIRVAFDQPLYVNNGTKIAEMGDLDGLTRLRCGRDLVESHCGTLGRGIPKRNANASDIMNCRPGTATLHGLNVTGMYPKLRKQERIKSWRNSSQMIWRKK